MLRSLLWKLALAFALVSLIGIVLVVLLLLWQVDTRSQAFESAFNRDIAGDFLADIYRANGGWPARIPAGAPFPRGRGMGEWVVLDADGRVIYSSRQGQVTLSRAALDAATAIVVDDTTVGYLLLGGTPMADAVAREVSQARAVFLGGVQRSALLAALGVTGMAVMIGIIIARSLIRPLGELTAATQAIAAGDLERKVAVRSDDEIGQLATAFNTMAGDLARSRDLRRQMTADIAHDLRTPLSVILGHAEGLKDGVLPANQETYNIIHDEAIRLNRLIDDLRTLSLADAGELTLLARPTPPAALVERALAVHGAQAQALGIALQGSVADGLPDVAVDPDRLAQVLDNLVSNALRFTPAGGRVQIAAARAANGVTLTVSDSGRGIDAADLPYVFARFYRGDRARQRQGEGSSSGLGLAISKSIVEQHGGTIGVESVPGAGTEFIVTLPVDSRQ